MRWPIDHVFHTEHFKLVSLERGPAIGSDHFPIFVELSLAREGPLQQEAPEAEAEDLEEANEKVIEGATEPPEEAEPPLDDDDEEEGADDKGDEENRERSG